MKKQTLLLLLLLFVTFSTSAQRSGMSREGTLQIEPLFNDLMLPSSGGLFRGVQFDWTKKQVKDKETSLSTTSVYEDEIDEELIITTDMGGDILNFADITYTFDEEGLYHIKVETYATTEEISDKVFNKVKDYFATKLGDGELAEDGFLEFNGKSNGYSYLVAIEKLEYSEGMHIYIYVN